MLLPDSFRTGDTGRPFHFKSQKKPKSPGRPDLIPWCHLLSLKSRLYILKLELMQTKMKLYEPVIWMKWGGGRTQSHIIVLLNNRALCRNPAADQQLTPMNYSRVHLVPGSRMSKRWFEDAERGAARVIRAHTPIMPAAAAEKLTHRAVRNRDSALLMDGTERSMGRLPGDGEGADEARVRLYHGKVAFLRQPCQAPAPVIFQFI